MVAADIILKSNNQWFEVNGVWTGENIMVNADKGVTMHRIYPLAAQQLANLIEPRCDSSFPLSYALACIDIEGIYDEACMNGNFSYVDAAGVHHVGSNPNREPEGFDVGCCQLKLRYVMESLAVDLTTATEFALTKERAVPYFFSVMTEHLQQAAMILANPPNDMNAAYKDVFVLATSIYNFGLAGMTKPIGSQPARITQPLVSHAQHVIDLERAFAGDLGVPSIFPPASP